MASTAALPVQVHEAGGLQRREAGAAFVDLLNAMEALLEAFLADKSCVFINILQAEAEKLSGFTPSIIQPEAAGRGLYARCKTR